MTGPRDDTPARRAEDHGALGQVRAWWKKWGQLVIGVVVLALAVATFVIGLEVRGYSRARAQDAQIVRRLAQQRAEDAEATAKAARQSCQRSKALGPSLALDYENRGVLSGANLALYKSLIPKTCPK